MKKIRLLVHERAASAVLRTVQEMGVLELTESEALKEKLDQKEKRVFAFNYTSSRLDFAVEFLSRFAPKPSVRTTLEGGKLLVGNEELAQIANSFYFNDTIDALQDIEERLNDADARLASLAEEKALLSQWETLDASLATGLETERTHTTLLSGGSAELGQITKELDKEEILYDIVLKAPHRLAIVTLKEHADAIRKAASGLRIEIIALPRRNGTPREVLAHIAQREAEEHKRKQEAESEVHALVPLLPKLKCMSDYIYWKKEKHNVLSKAPRTEATLVFEGWAPVKKLSALHAAAGEITSHFAIEEIAPTEGEEPPIEIENKKLIRPFEALTRLYGMPAAGNLDPTLFLSGFFFIFFGICLADAGYGVLLALFTAIPLILFRLPRGTKQFFQLFFLSGIATAIVGVFFGGYFGVEGHDISSLTSSLQIFEPVREPLPIMFLALALGVIQIMFGLFLKVVSHAKNGHLKEGLYEPGTWLLLFAALIIWGAQSAGVLALSHRTALGLFFVALLLAVLGHGAKAKNIFAKPFLGLLSIFHESIGFFSDTLSYTRLLALGLASTALAETMNLIAGISSGLPYVGTIVMVLILVLGHLFTIAIGVLGAFVHSVRLQYVEFFGKFISGSGRTFAPLKRQERYIALKEAGR